MHRRGLFLVVLLLLGTAGAQSSQVQFELGFGGQVVDGAWNPLRLVVRDLPRLSLEIYIDQGSLRGGEVPVHYSVEIPPSRGVRVFEDDLFIPPWRTLTWAVRTEERTVASGSFDPRTRDPRPLTLLLSTVPGRWLEILPPETRVREASAYEMPVRAAAYSSVESIIVDGTSVAPSEQAVLAAATAGTTVVLVTPLPGNFSGLLALVEGQRALGAGWLVRADASAVPELLPELPSFPVATLSEAMESRPPVGSGPVPLRLTVLLAGGVYALLALLLVRFGGSAGLPAALLVGVIVAGAGWYLLRPPESLLEERTAYRISAGGLGVEQATLDLKSLPGGTVTVDEPVRLLRPYRMQLSPDATRLQLDRWQREVMLGKPTVTVAQLEWVGGELLNRGSEPLNDLLVVGYGLQGSLPAGETLLPVLAEEVPLPEAYARLLPYLPFGSALARSDDTFHVTLAPDWDESFRRSGGGPSNGSNGQGGGT